MTPGIGSNCHRIPANSLSLECNRLERWSAPTGTAISSLPESDARTVGPLEEHTWNESLPTLVDTTARSSPLTLQQDGYRSPLEFDESTGQLKEPVSTERLFAEPAQAFAITDFGVVGGF